MSQLIKLSLLTLKHIFYEPEISFLHLACIKNFKTFSNKYISCGPIVNVDLQRRDSEALAEYQIFRRVTTVLRLQLPACRWWSSEVDNHLLLKYVLIISNIFIKILNYNYFKIWFF
jgi:hypothetical protein